MLSEGKLVALVEDNPDDRFLFERAWRGAGIKNPLRMFEDGQKALEYLFGTGEYVDRTRHPLPDLALLDIKMPGLSGLDVLERLRGDEKFRRLPVAIMTASRSPGDIAEAYRLGANAFFIKPSSIQELIELLKALKECWLRFNEFPELQAAG
jgi:CheY-like chemotaxis protein